jgi:hypothetical protein
VSLHNETFGAPMWKPLPPVPPSLAELKRLAAHGFIPAPPDDSVTLRGVEDPSPLHQIPGGATRSEKAPDYDIVPMDGFKRTAQRFGYGAKTHGRDNWKLSLDTREHAQAFCREAYNHGMEHMLRMGSGYAPEDDHIGAIGFMVTVLAYAENKFGCRWTEL